MPPFLVLLVLSYRTYPTGAFQCAFTVAILSDAVPLKSSDLVFQKERLCDKM
jgi:hypothetical protein